MSASCRTTRSHACMVTPDPERETATFSAYCEPYSTITHLTVVRVGRRKQNPAGRLYSPPALS